ncbi:uncharacterized protein ACRADG_000263 isoform 1-T8 [Cochliomyia hominivorax]
MLKSYKIYTCTNGTLGLHLSRAPWDPYPWVSSIQKDSNSYQAGLRIGDCLLELNGQDVLGMKISEIAALLKNHWLNESSNYVTVVIWRNKCNGSNNNNSTSHSSNGEDATTDACHGDNDDDTDEDEENNAHNINQQSLQKFATCLQHIAQLLECPVCLEVIKPPGWQCCNGHVLCNNCRSRSEKCPVCRVPLGPRGRCLLSDKLFTLLADSFPCDGVRSNKNSPKDRRKCSTEFHNQPKMAIVQKQHQQQQQQQHHDKDEQQGVKKTKDFLLTSLRYRRRKISSSKINEGPPAGVEKQEEQQHPSRQKQAMYDTNSVIVAGNSNTTTNINRKSSADYMRETQLQTGVLNVKDNGVGASVACTTLKTTLGYNELHGQTVAVTTKIQQCHCITCYKPDKVAIVNNVTGATNTTTTATAAIQLNKYILRIASQEQQENNVQQQQQQQEYKEKYQNYQCPTGKLCCLNVNVMPLATCKNINNENITTTTLTNNKLSTVMTTTTTPKQINANVANLVVEEQEQEQNQHQFNFHKTLKNEWEILAHLSQDHQLPVNQYYAEYGQRIEIQNLLQQNSITCLNLKGSNEHISQVEKFFIVCVPLEMTSNSTIISKVAIFVYHMNSLTSTIATNATATITSSTTSTTSYNDEVSNFETIIENPLTGIKWFGQAHPLTTPWSHILEKQHFLQHIPRQTHLDEAAHHHGGDDAFVIVVKRKFEMKTKI